MATMKPNPTGNYIKEVTLPSGNVYEIVDEAARGEINTQATNITSISSNVNSLSSNVASISSNVSSLSSTVNNMSKYTAFLGVVSHSAAWTKIEDGSTSGTILVGSTTTTVTTGNIVIYKPSSSTSAAQEYIWNGSTWNFFGDISAEDLGDLAYKSSASSGSTKYVDGITVSDSTDNISVTVSYQPAGTIALTDSTATLSLATTSTKPSNTANYWVYNAASNISISANIPATNTGNFMTGVEGRSVVSNISTAEPAASVPTGGVVYASVTSHNLKLNYLV